MTVTTAERESVTPVALNGRDGEEGLVLRQVSKRFESVHALADCSFSVPRGRMLGFLGPNGTGKTTAMRAVFGLVQLDVGDVL
jgi:ABC-type multidrug transport system ATPase subunit